MRLLLLPLPSNAGREDENLAGLERALGEAPPVDLAVVAEAFEQGFEAITEDPRHDLAMGWEESSPEIAQDREMARRHRTAICFGFIERAGDVLHSSAIVVDRDGTTLALYRRMSPGWRGGEVDTSVYVDGTEPVCFELCGQRVTIALCGDLWVVPERFAQLDADPLLWPVFVNFTPDRRSGEISDYSAQAGSVCRRVALVNSLADQTPTSPEWAGTAHGGAAWFTNGTVAASLPMGQPGQLVVHA